MYISVCILLLEVIYGTLLTMDNRHHSSFIKSYKFHPTSAFNYEFHTLSHPTIFLTARGRSKEFLSIPAGTIKYSTHSLRSHD